MRILTFDTAQAFLDHAGAALEENEAANCLMLGICGQLVDDPHRYPSAPCLKLVVTSEGGLVLAALMTPPHKLVVSSTTGDDVLRAPGPLVDDLLQGGWQIPGVTGAAGLAGSLARAWCERTGQATRLATRLWLYVLHGAPDVTPLPGRLRRAREDDVPLVAGWWDRFNRETFGRSDEEQTARTASLRIADGVVYLWEDGDAVSMAIQTRPTRSGISIGLVYTPPAERGKGYATACVGALSRLLLSGGVSYVALFADAANPASNKVYQRLGYRPIAEFHEIEFFGEPLAEVAAG